jgi:hypothetical protein
MTPDSKNIYVGTGEVMFNRFDAAGAPTTYRHLGNVSKMEVTPSVTKIEKKSSMNAARATIASAITETKMGLSLTLSEFDPKNVALALLGTTSVLSQASATKSDASLGNATLGDWLNTGGLGITVTAVKTGSTTLVLGTDYEVKASSGMIRILPTSTAVDDGDPITWSGTIPAKTYTQVQGLTNGKIEGMLRYESSLDNNGPRQLIDIWRVQINPDGALGFLSDDFADIPLTGDVLLDSSRPVGEQFLRDIFLDTAA